VTDRPDPPPDPSLDPSLAEPVRDLAGAPAGEPADELTATRLELQRQQRLFRSAFGHQFQFMAILSPEGRVVDFNEQFALGTRLPRNEVVGHLFWETAWWRGQPEIVAAWPMRLQAAAGADAPGIYHDRFTSPDGEPRWAEAAVHMLRDEQGRPEGFVVQATDTTEWRRAEAQRADAERRLRDAQKLHAIGTLAGGIAHDFNNILGAIRGNLALALDSLPPGHAALAPLAQIERASLRGRSLVRQILAFSRNEVGELRPEPLQPLIEETVALLRPTLSPGVRLRTQLDPATVWVQVNASQVHQVLMNLCTNAWQALPDRGGEITIGLDRLADGEAHLWVADDGAGMDAETQRRAFEPFFTTKPVDVGTGLGLSVVHGVLTAHGGRVAVESAPGRGTTVHVHLPLASGEAEADSADPAAPPADAGTGRHVLYLDDDEVMAPLADQLLQRGGYRVTTHIHSDAALAALRDPAHGVDIVVTDFNMPGLNGLDVIRELKRLAPTLPVVLTSGYIDDGLRGQAARLGVQHLLNKEDLREALCRTVGAALASASAE
jgi:PAS domain S-box-containing protein